MDEKMVILPPGFASDLSQQVAGEFYTINENIVRDQLEHIDAHFHPDRYAKF